MPNMQAGDSNEGHPLGGEPVKTNEDGTIDFDQFMTLMVFCTKLTNQQMQAPNADLIAKRRAAAKAGNDAEY